MCPPPPACLFPIFSRTSSFTNVILHEPKQWAFQSSNVSSSRNTPSPALTFLLWPQKTTPMTQRIIISRTTTKDRLRKHHLRLLLLTPSRVLPSSPPRSEQRPSPKCSVRSYLTKNMLTLSHGHTPVNTLSFMTFTYSLLSSYRSISVKSSSVASYVSSIDGASRV